MRRRWSLLLSVAVLAYAGWRYVVDRYEPFDTQTIPCAFDPDDPAHNTLADIPAAFRRLDGRRVAVEGFMIPMDQAEGIRQFALVPTLWGERRPPLVQDTILVDTAVPRPYCPDRIRLFGRLHVKLMTDDGFVLGVYRLDLDRFELVTPPVVPTPRWPLRVCIGVATTAVITAVAVRRRARRRWLRASGLCVGCRHDLRATPDRCPECGRVDAKAAARG